MRLNPLNLLSRKSSYVAPVETRVGPRPFPYDTATMSDFGAYQVLNHTAESRHISLGRDGWAPILYFLTLRKAALKSGANSALCRYFDLAGAKRGVSLLEQWSTVSSEEHVPVLNKCIADLALFEPLRLAQLRRRDPRSPSGTDDAAANQLTYLLHALAPPNRGVMLCCPRNYADFLALPEHKEYRDMVKARYLWLLEHVRRDLALDGLEVDGPLVKVVGYKASLFDEFDIYDF